MTSCYKYDTQWWHFIVPSAYEYRKLCDSYDKTYMFLVSSIRFIFYVCIFAFLYANNIIIFDEFKSVQYFFFILFFIITLLSFINLVMVSFKKQANPQTQIPIERERAPPEREQIIPIEVNIDDLSATQLERAESGY